MVKFEELGLSEDILRVLGELEFEEPTEIQEKAIPLALAGEDIIGGSATGSGKTLAFASTIIENVKHNGGVQSLVLTPTRELACQVAEAIELFAKYKNLKVLPVYGGVSISTQIDQLDYTDIVVGTPGRVLDHLERRTLDLKKVNFLVLDEVDRMFDMGFHIDVEKIINKCPEVRQTMLFSATVSGEVDYFAKKYTKNAKTIVVKSLLDPSKLKQVYYDVPNNKKFSLLVHLLNNENAGLVMIFTNTKRNADFITRNLYKVGINAKAIHGGLSQNRRSNVLSDFHDNKVGVLVCTDVAARGLDIKGVSHVYNYDLPNSAEDYIHRVGRTARAGENGKAVNLLSSRDYDNFRSIMDKDGLNIKLLENPIFDSISISMDSSRGRDGRGGRSSGGDRSSGFRRSDSRSSSRPSYGGSSSGGDRSSSRPSYGGRSSGGDRSSSRPSYGGRSSDGDRSSSRPSYGGRSSSGDRGSSRSSFGGSSDRSRTGGNDKKSFNSGERRSESRRPKNSFSRR